MSDVRAWKEGGNSVVNVEVANVGVGSVKRYAHLRRPAMYRVVLAQLLTTFCLSLLLLPLGMVHVISAAVGGLACAIPNAFLLWKLFKYRGASAAQKITKSFYQGEAGKFALTMLAFVLIFTLIDPVEPLALFGVFIAVQLVNWFTPLLIRHQ